MPAKTSAAQIMTREVTTFAMDDVLLDAAGVLFDNNWGGAPVVQDGEVVGVVTLMDVISTERSVHAPKPLVLFDALLWLGSRRFDAEMRKVSAMTVGEAMNSPARTVGPDASVADIAALMADEGLTCVPVVDDGKLVGVVGRRDVVGLILGRVRASQE